MRIGVDLRPLYTGSKYRGIGVYAKQLITELLHLAPEHEYHFLNVYGDFPEGIPFNERCFLHSYYQGPMIEDCGHRNVFRIPELESIREAQVINFLDNSKIDWMLFTSPLEYGNPFRIEWFQSVHTAAVIYDLIPLAFPEQCLFDERYKSDYMDSLEFIKGVDLLLSISQFTKDDIVRRLGIPEKKIKAIMAGIDPRYLEVHNPGLTDLQKRFPLCDHYFLFAGGIDFKKNIERIITAYGAIPPQYRKNTMLVIAGKADPSTIQHYMDEAEKARVGESVICTNYISDSELMSLYCNACALVFPSLYEGFGLPVIEAMACGTAVITSNNSSLKEVAGDHAILVDPEDTGQICKAMQYVLQNPEKMEKMVQAAIPYARQFTWAEVAQKTLDALNATQIQTHARKITKPFFVNNAMLESIAHEYYTNHLTLSEKECGRVSDELYALEKHVTFPAIPCSKRILYDVTVIREWLEKHYITGISRASLEIYHELKKYAEVIPVTIDKKSRKFLFHSVDMSTFQIQDNEISPSARDIYFMPELQLRGIQVSDSHPSPAQLREKGIQTYAVLYDILPLQMPQYFEDKTSKAFYPYVRNMVSEYDGILTDSRAVSDDLIGHIQSHPELFPDHDLQIGYFHLGMDTAFKGESDETVSPNIKEIFKKKTFLMVGTLEPRKGHSYVLSVFEALWAKDADIQLCIIGHVGWNMDGFLQMLKQHSEYGKKLYFLEGASDNILCFAYRHASALIQASAGEGFGLPLIEAGCYGLPILCSDIPVFHEVAGENASYFRRDTDELEQLIQAVEKGDKYVLKDSTKIRRLSWSDSARKIANMILGGAGWYQVIRENEIKDAVQIPEPYQALDFSGADEQDHLTKRRVLFVFQNDFLRGGQGTNNRVMALARAVRDAGFTLDVLGAEHFSEFGWSNFEEENEKENLIDILRVYDYQTGYKEDGITARAYRKMRERYAGENLQDWTRPGMRCMLEEMLGENRYEAVCTFYSYLLPLFEDLPSECKKVYFMEDCTFLQQYSWSNGNSEVTLGSLLNDELSRLANVDEIICISYDEKIMYEKLLGRDVHFLPHLVEKQIPAASKDIPKKWDAFFVGFNNPFNVEGMQWYIDQVVPLLPKEFRTVVVGSVTKELRSYPQNVDVIPYAENLEDIYCNGRICICPMFRGTGMKIKVVEAMAHGIPVVCNTRGVDGLPDKMLSGCLVTNDPEGFAQYLIKLGQDDNFYLNCKKQIGNYYKIIFDRNRYVELLKRTLRNEQSGLIIYNT